MMNRSNWDIGVCSWSLKDDFDMLSKLKQEHNVSTIHLHICPNVETECSIKKMQDNGWNISSAMVDFPQEDYSTLDSIKKTGGILPIEYWPQNRKRVLDAIDIIADTSIKFLSMHFGFLEKTNTDLIDKIKELADYAADKNKTLLMETGQETARQLSEFIQLINHKAIAVNFDPANMILYDKGSPVESIEPLKPWIKHIHIKDAIPSSQPNQWGKEVPWSQGQVHAENFLNKLMDIDYKGTLCIERESGNNRYNDIASAIHTCRGIIKSHTNKKNC